MVSLEGKCNKRGMLFTSTSDVMDLNTLLDLKRQSHILSVAFLNKVETISCRRKRLNSWKSYFCWQPEGYCGLISGSQMMRYEDMHAIFKSFHHV